MSTLVEAFRLASLRLRQEYGLEVGLDRIAAELDEAGPNRSLELMSKELDKRIQAIREARAVLKRLTAAVQHLQPIADLTLDGWPRRREELAALLKRKPKAGLAAWLGDWLTAASMLRLDALERLQEAQLPLPNGAWLLVERAIAASQGLSERNWELATPLVRAGALGLEVDGISLPRPLVRQDLRLLIARLAIEQGRYDEAEAALEEAKLAPAPDEESERSPVILALRSRIARRRADRQAAATRLGRVRRSDGRNLDVAVELIVQARADERPTAALDDARAAIEALPSLIDVDAELAGLMTDLPAELWVAVAERAALERDGELLLRALDRAESAATGDNSLLAQVAEQRADALSSRQEVPRAAAVLADAGGYRLAAGQYDSARINYERALELDPQNDVASLGLADFLRILTYGEPVAIIGDPLRRALQLVGRVRQGAGLTPGNSWGYLVEALAHVEMARIADPARVDELWRGLLSAERALAHQSEEAVRWSRLAETASAVGLWKVAFAFSEHALSLSKDTDTKGSAVNVRASIGHVQGCLELLEDNTEPWATAIRAYVMLRTGRVDEALRLLKPTPLEPLWYWARQTLITALMLGGEPELAEKEAGSLLADVEDRLDDYECLTVAASAALVARRPEDAERWGLQAEELDPGGPSEADAAGTVALAHLLQGDPERCLEALERMVRKTRNPREIIDWESILRPQLEWLAAREGIPLPDLGPIDALVKERGRELALIEAEDEVSLAPGDLADPFTVARAKAFLLPFLRLVEGDADAALQALERGAADLENDAEARILRERLVAANQRAADDRRRRELARQAVEAAGTDEAAAAALRTLLAEVPDQADELLAAAAEGKPLGPLIDELRSFRGSWYQDRAAAVATRLGGEVGLPAEEGDQQAQTTVPPALRLSLPPSWFEGHPDPVNDHPLFLRYLPEARFRSGGTLPGVIVEVNERLESDGYQILSHGEVADEGQVDRSCRYCPQETLGLLPPELRERAGQDPGTGLCKLASQPGQEMGGLAELLTMPAFELVARRVASVAHKQEKQTELAWAGVGERAVASIRRWAQGVLARVSS